VCQRKEIGKAKRRKGVCQRRGKENREDGTGVTKGRESNIEVEEEEEERVCQRRGTENGKEDSGYIRRRVGEWRDRKPGYIKP
jgi:hypothetical protein